MPKRHRLGLRITGPARRDIAAIVRWSLQEFGEDATLRYGALIHQALRDIAADLERPGAKPHAALTEGTLYHLRNSRDRTRIDLGTVRNPRHFVIYRPNVHDIEVLRILHDARALERHLSEEQCTAQNIPKAKADPLSRPAR